ncbi:MAG: BPL-N domain-containing protein [Planctomycetota bacterium]
MRSILICLLLIAKTSFAADPIRVAVFEGDGVGKSVGQLVEAIETGDSDQIFRVSRISADAILEGELAQYDVLVHPGGSGSKQGKALGETGRDHVRKFVRDGGGFLGVCAGAYLATNDYTWSLNLIDAKVVDRMHWARGNGDVMLKLSSNGTTFFRHDSNAMQIRYGQGPLLGRREWDDKEVPDYESLAIYDSEIATKGAPKGIMKGTSAIVRTQYGRGRVMCFSPHPELTDGKHHMISIAVTWLGNAATDESTDCP